MKNNKRNNRIHFRVSDDEREIINKKMSVLGITNMAEYLRRMSIYGYMLEVDLKPLNNLATELGRIGNNINQLAKRANETGNIYYEDIEKSSRDLLEMKGYLKEFTKQILDDIA